VSCSDACSPSARTRSSTRRECWPRPVCRYRSPGRGRASRAGRRSCAYLLDAHEVIQLLARIRKVLAQMVVDGHALLLHLRLHHLRDERHAAAARRAGAWSLLESADAGRTGAHRRADFALGDVVARADLRAGGQRVDAEPRLRLAVACGRIRNSGASGSSMRFSIICSNVPYSAASPTITAPSSCLPHSDTTSFL
jgi:hypothetical protein